ncbi:MAG TPA: hypothetical protein PKC28_14700 [Bdellovibrionales bacterium]|nr:hypothetical protein [Bdellovibrionales bacterium]
MDQKIKAATATYVAPRLLSAFRFRYLVFGAVAYFGLRYLNKRGILPRQTGAALDLIDSGIDMAKKQVGLGAPSAKDAAATSMPH